MSLSALCAAAIAQSDNTAGNLLLKQIGGPEGLTEFARSLGDEVTRLDRWEPDLNTAFEGDERDTTSPNAMLGDVQRLLFGDVLTPQSRELLASWMVATTTGAERIRAGLPSTWRVGDKTGTGQNGAANDVAVLWPPGRAPLLVAAYYAESKGAEAARNAVLAEVGRQVAANF